MKEYSECIMNCHKALDIDSSNIKALFRKGQAHSRMNEFEKAKTDFLEAIKLSPENKEVKQELEILKKKMTAYKQQEKQMFAGLFKTSAPTKTENENTTKEQ